MVKIVFKNSFWYIKSYICENENPYSKHGKTIRRKVNTVIMKLGRNATCNLTWANGRLSNFDAVASYFSDKGYKIVIRIYLYTLKIF
jgi:hypothetical protein